jgi:hypothetical protein
VWQARGGGVNLSQSCLQQQYFCRAAAL